MARTAGRTSWEPGAVEISAEIDHVATSLAKVRAMHDRAAPGSRVRHVLRHAARGLEMALDDLEAAKIAAGADDGR